MQHQIVLNQVLQSQHRPIGIHVKAAIPPNIVPFKRRFNYKKADLKGFTKEFEQNVRRTTPIAQNYNMFADMIKKSARRHIPRGWSVDCMPGLSDGITEEYQEYVTCLKLCEETSTKGEKVMEHISKEQYKQTNEQTNKQASKQTKANRQTNKRKQKKTKYKTKNNKNKEKKQNKQTNKNKNKNKNKTKQNKLAFPYCINRYVQEQQKKKKKKKKKKHGQPLKSFAEIPKLLLASLMSRQTRLRTKINALERQIWKQSANKDQAERQKVQQRPRIYKTVYLGRSRSRHFHP